MPSRTSDTGCALLPTTLGPHRTHTSGTHGRRLSAAALTGAHHVSPAEGSVMYRRTTITVAVFASMMAVAATARAQGHGPPGMGMGMMGMGRDSATRAQMRVIHELVTNHTRIERTVTNLPDGIRTVTTSADPAIARLIKDHVLTMDQRVTRGDDPGLPMESEALRAIFRGKDKIMTVADTTANGI